MQPTKKTPTAPLAPTLIESRIHNVCGLKVILDSDIAELYGVITKALVQAVKRNLDRFPADFVIQLDITEWNDLRSQIVISSPRRGGRRYAPYAFTELGVAMLSSVLSSTQAIAVNIEIMRAFVRLREVIVSNKELAQRLNELEKTAELISLRHDNLEHDTRLQFQQVFDAIRELMAPPNPVKKRPIGFVSPEDPS